MFIFMLGSFLYDILIWDSSVGVYCDSIAFIGILRKKAILYVGFFAASLLFAIRFDGIVFEGKLISYLHSLNKKLFRDGK